LSYGPESLAEARASLERIDTCMRNLAGGQEAPMSSERDSSMAGYFEECERGFREAMDDDFNSAAALGVIFSLVKEINTYVGESGGGSPQVNEQALGLLRRLCGTLGLFQQAVEPVEPVDEGPDRGRLIELLQEVGQTAGEQKDLDLSDLTREQLIELLLEERQAAREKKDFELSDLIRGRLSDLGVRIEDVRDGYRWHFKR
jgi:cysteinyl-tRNA synthetase